MARLELLEGDDVFGASARVYRTIPLAKGDTVVGRELLAINDKRLSRQQLQFHVGGSNSVSVTRVGANASFLQLGASEEPSELPRGVATDIECQNASHIIYLSQHPDTLTFLYPSRLLLDANDSAPLPAPAPAAAAPPAPAPLPPPGVWHVKLGGSFKPYDPPVQLALEAAFLAGERTADVTVRGTEYTIQLHAPAKQICKADPTKTRPVRREGGAPPPTAPPPAAPPPAAAAPDPPPAPSPPAPVAPAPLAPAPSPLRASPAASSPAPAAPDPVDSTSIAAAASSAEQPAASGGGEGGGGAGDGGMEAPVRKRSMKELLAEEEERVKRLAGA